MAASSANLISITQGLAQLGVPKAVAYGHVRAAGNLVQQRDMADKSTAALILLGEGPWDGCERFWLRRKLIDVTDTTIFHFHPGTDAVLGSGLVPISTGGDQAVDAFWALFPSNMQAVTYDRMAYVVLHAPPDPGAVSADMEWIGDYRCMQVRSFDATGSQLAFAFSTNPAWVMLDMIIRTALKPEGVINEALIAGELARFDWASWADSASYFDFDVSNGVGPPIKRFEASVAFPNQTPLGTALQQLTMLSRSYLIESRGKIILRPDRPRTSVFIVDPSHVVPGSLKVGKSQLRGADNRFVGQFNDLQPMRNVDISFIAVASGVATVTTVQVHPYLANDNAVITGNDNATLNAAIVITSVPDGNHFTFTTTAADGSYFHGWVGTLESRFIQRAPYVDHEPHQNSVGQRGLGLAPTYKRNVANFDFGNNTWERVMRLLNFYRDRILGPVTLSPWKAPWEATLRAFWGAVDINGNRLRDVLPGDVVTLNPLTTDEFTADYEVSQTDIVPVLESGAGEGGSGGQSGIYIDLTLKQYYGGIFTDISDTETTIIVDRTPTAPVPAVVLDQFGALHVDPSTPAVLKKGSVPPMFNPGVTANVRSDGMDWQFLYTVVRTDRGLTQVPVNTHQDIAGLTAGTSYTWYLFHDEVSGGPGGVQTGGVGTPLTWAHVGTNRLWSAEQFREDHIALSSAPIVLATTASGTSTGGGGGDGGCLWHGAVIRERHHGNIRTGELFKMWQNGERNLYLWGRKDKNPDAWLKVLKVERRPHDLWFWWKFDNEAQIVATCLHPFTTIDIHGKDVVCLAQDMSPAMQLYSPTGICSPCAMKLIREVNDKVPIVLESPHTFYASEDGEHWVLTHNTLIQT